jgi:hypothetical protein
MDFISIGFAIKRQRDIGYHPSWAPENGKNFIDVNKFSI